MKILTQWKQGINPVLVTLNWPPHTIPISIVQLTDFVSEITRRVYFTRAVLFYIQRRSVVRPKSYSVRWPLHDPF